MINSMMSRLDPKRFATAFIVFVLLGAGVAYAKPDEFVRNPVAALRTAPNSVVYYIDQLTKFPIWSVAFLLCFAWLLIGLLRRSYDALAYGHLVSAMVVAGYTTAVFTTALINPHTYVMTALLSLSLLGWNLVMMYLYSKPEPSHIASPAPDHAFDNYEDE